MAYITFRYAAKIPLQFTPVNVFFTREVNASKDVLIPYVTGSGQSLVIGQVLYTQGSTGEQGYLEIHSKTNQTLSDAGNMQTVFYHYPSAEQGDMVLNFSYDSSPITANFFYNSIPETEDVILEKENRTVHTFQLSDFVFSDYDGDPITEIAIFGDVTGYEYNDDPYVAGTWMPVYNIDDEALKYNPLDQDAYYEKINTYKVKDSQGNISVG